MDSNIQSSFFIWLNGRFIPQKEAGISFFTNSFHYGTSVFEGIRCYPSEDGGGYIFRLGDHMRRFFYSADSLGIPIKFSLIEIERAAAETVKKNGHYSLYLRPIAYIAEETLGIFPQKFQTGVAILPLDWKGQAQPLSVTISTLRRIHPATTNINAKISGHYVNSYLAKREAKKLGYDDAILCDAEGFIAEGTTQNVFLVKKGAVLTPKLHAILPGITRSTVITILNDMGMETRESAVTPEELYTADEVFFTGTAAEIQAVVGIDGKRIADGVPGLLTRDLKKRYYSIVHGDNKQYLGWLTRV